MGQGVVWVGALPQIVTQPASPPPSLLFPDWVLKGADLSGVPGSHSVTNQQDYLSLAESSLQIQMWLWCWHWKRGPASWLLLCLSIALLQR